MDITARLKILSGDILGGINSAIITLPQALAFGVAIGFGASAGIWGAIILCAAAGLLGTKTPLISGITGPVAIILASTMAALHNDINAVIAIMLMAAIFQFFAGLTSLPNIIKYIPYPVISGFMNGIGFVIIILQLNPLLGINAQSSTISSVKAVIKNLTSVNLDAALIGIITLIMVFAVPKRLNKYIPIQIIALIVCTFLSIKWGLNIERISQVSLAYPQISIPAINFEKFLVYLPFALTLAIICSSESMLTGLVSDALTKTNINPKRLLTAQGAGNILCALTGSVCGSAATMRSVTAINSGATTKLVTLINPAILFILLFQFSDFVAQIPLAVLAAILIKIGYDIVDTKLLKVLKYAPKDDLYVLAVVFFLTVFYNLIFAVGAGITLASLLYARRVADRAKIIHKSVYDREIMEMEKILEKDYRHRIRVAHINGQFFFGSATHLISKFDEMLGTKYLILNYDSEDLLDISAIFALEDIITRLKAQRIKILLVVKNKEIYDQLQSHNIASKIGDERIFYSEIEAIEAAKLLIKNKIRRKMSKG